MLEDLPLKVVVVVAFGLFAVIACSMRLRISIAHSARHMRMAYENRNGYMYEPVLTTEQARRLLAPRSSPNCARSVA